LAHGHAGSVEADVKLGPGFQYGWGAGAGAPDLLLFFGEPLFDLPADLFGDSLNFPRFDL
jgi:hypothetical protein